MMQNPMQPHPNPIFRRRDWLSLDGTWEFGFDDGGAGPAAEWLNKPDFGSSIVVPFAYQAKLSGIGDRSVHPVMWYRRRFDIPTYWRSPRTLLHFGAIDYRAEFWLNGSYLGTHEGGYTPIVLDITRAARPTDNVIVVRAEDRPSREQPCGKQDRESHQPY
jgi:beta-galactosidase/beta-glucuronidase